MPGEYIGDAAGRGVGRGVACDYAQTTFNDTLDEGTPRFSRIDARDRVSDERVVYHQKVAPRSFRPLENRGRRVHRANHFARIGFERADLEAAESDAEKVICAV